ncbi:CRISPR-associated endoribonuclease Cas2 [Azospirillaceae bacterium]
MNRDLGRFVACYDVANNRRRRKIVEILDGYGARVQESVFEMLLDCKLLEAVVAAVSKVMDGKEDRITFYPVCRACEGRRIDLGLAAEKPPPGREKYIII